jgi:serine protease Do
MKRNAVAWAALVVSAGALVSSSGVMRTVPAAPSMPTESHRTVRALSDAFVAVAEAVRPSVVQINVQKKGGLGTIRIPGGQGRRNPFQGPNGGATPKEFEDLLRDMLKRFGNPDLFEHQQFGGIQRGTGSGFLYDDRGHILTNNHVVENAGKIVVTFHDGTEASATVVGTDPKTDVAVIKVDNTGYRPVPRGASSNLRVGELVMAVGSPFGLSQSVSTGIISATERTNLGINEGNDTYESFLQTDAAINPGNSGGPLVNMDGQVIGVTSAIVTGGRGNDGVGFAIPIDLASHVAEKLIRDGKVNRARIGVGIKPITPAAARVLGIDPKIKGALVEAVVPGSPADKAGLEKGDVITGFNGKEIVSVPSFRLNVAASDIGKPYGLTYFRNGEEHRTNVVLGSADKIVFNEEKESAATSEESPKPEAAKTPIESFGLEVQPLTADLAKGLGVAKDVQGLLISSVKEGSPAETEGLKPGMVITQVVRDKKVRPVKDVKDFQDFAAKSDELMVYVQPTDGQGGFVTLSKSKKN